MFPNLVPLRAVVFQALFLLVAIAVESIVLQRQLKLAPRVGVQYAASINLLSTVVGWLMFFLLFNFANLPGDLKPTLISFIFFDRWSGDVVRVLILASFFTFFISFLVKERGLLLLQRLLGQQPPRPARKEPTPETILRDYRKEPPEVQPQFAAVLFANAASYSAIVMVMFFRLALQNSFGSLLR